MGAWEHRGVRCNEAHDAKFWYYRTSKDDGREYLCGERYNRRVDKAS
jgi:hypothetical protein